MVNYAKRQGVYAVDCASLNEVCTSFWMEFPDTLQADEDHLTPEMSAAHLEELSTQRVSLPTGERTILQDAPDSSHASAVHREDSRVRKVSCSSSLALINPPCADHPVCEPAVTGRPQSAGEVQPGHHGEQGWRRGQGERG